MKTWIGRDTPGRDASIERHPPRVSDHQCISLSNKLYSQCAAKFTDVGAAPAGDSLRFRVTARRQTGRLKPSSPLYSTEERRRRDATPWTLVQGVLAPIQFLVFLVSVALVLRYLASGEGFVAATVSV